MAKKKNLKSIPNLLNLRNGPKKEAKGIRTPHARLSNKTYQNKLRKKEMKVEKIKPTHNKTMLMKMLASLEKLSRPVGLRNNGKVQLSIPARLVNPCMMT